MGRSSKRQEPGLNVIVGFGLLNCVSPLLAVLPHFSVENIPFDKIAYFGGLWALSFVLVRHAKANTSPLLDYFRDFNLWKGAALILLWPALKFWWLLLGNYHESLEIISPFLSPIMMHLTAALLTSVGSVIFFVSRLFKHHRKNKPMKLWPWMEGIVPNMVWVRFFFRSNGPSPLGRALSLLVGSAYLLYLYLSIISAALLVSMTVATNGTVKEVRNVGYFIASKYGGMRNGHYCLLTLATADGVSHFAFNQCPACACTAGKQVTVKHNALDYFSRRTNSLECLGAQ
jgi:hypothetical protein